MKHETDRRNGSGGLRVRNRLKRDATRPRLAIFRSHKNIYAQIIDDDAGRTWWRPAAATRRSAQELRYGGNKTAAAAVGKAMAQRALEAGVKKWCSIAAITSITAAWPPWPRPPGRPD